MRFGRLQNTNVKHSCLIYSRRNFVHKNKLRSHLAYVLDNCNSSNEFKLFMCTYKKPHIVYYYKTPCDDLLFLNFVILPRLQKRHILDIQDLEQE